MTKNTISRMGGVNFHLGGQRSEERGRRESLKLFLTA